MSNLQLHACITITKTQLFCPAFSVGHQPLHWLPDTTCGSLWKCKLRQQNCEVSTSLVSSYLVIPGQILRQPSLPCQSQDRLKYQQMQADQTQGDPCVQLPAISANTLCYVSR